MSQSSEESRTSEPLEHICRVYGCDEWIPETHLLCQRCRTALPASLKALVTGYQRNPDRSTPQALLALVQRLREHYSVEGADGMRMVSLPELWRHRFTESELTGWMDGIDYRHSAPPTPKEPTKRARKEETPRSESVPVAITGGRRLV